MLSFIVPAHDEARLLGPTLENLHQAARSHGLAPGRGYEIVVVDDASTDATAAIANRCGARVVQVAFRHIAATRNAGVRAAAGEVLLFVDADTRVDAGVVSAALAALGTGAVGGGAAVRLLGAPRRRERWLARVLEHAFRATRIAPGCFLFCTRAAFEAAGGFDERYFAGEDVAISRALSRVGRFVILRTPVWTSDRKLRTFPMRDHLALLRDFLRHGRGMLRSRERLALWYDARRHPDGEGPPGADKG